MTIEHSSKHSTAQNQKPTPSTHHDFKEVLCDLNPRQFDPLPTLPEELSGLIQPLLQFIPEINRYSPHARDAEISDAEKQMRAIEFPRTVGALLNLACMVRMAELLNTTESGQQRNLAQMTQEAAEYNFFARENGARITIEQFRGLARLFTPLVEDPEGLLTVATSIVYGDLFKLDSFKEPLNRAMQAAAPADHDEALREAFSGDNFKSLSELFPTFSSLSSESQRRISNSILYGVNLGHVFQMETCAAALSGLKILAQSESDLTTFWFLPTIMDISSARVDHQKPETWFGSTLITAPLAECMIDFASALPRLKGERAEQFFRSFQDDLYKRDFYDPIREAPELSNDDKFTVFALARYFSLETDNRVSVVPQLVSAWKELPTENKQLISDYFARSGFDPQSPKVVVTYLPYLFTKVLAPAASDSAGNSVSQGLSQTLGAIAQILGKIENFMEQNPSDEPLRVFAGQDLWFKDLLPLTKLSPQELAEYPLVFTVEGEPGKLPTVRLQPRSDSQEN